MVALVALGALAGAVIQSSSGLGFGLVLGPIAFALLDPEPAVVVLIALGLSLNIVLLTGLRRRPDVVWREVGPILVAAVPGAVCGVLLLQALPKSVLQVVVGVAVVGAALVRVRLRETRPAVAVGRPGDGPARMALGLAAGTMTTSVGVAGPPLALWLARHGLTPSQMRDSLAAAFLALGVMGVVALLPLILGGDDVVDGGALAGGLAGVLVGHAIGSRLFARLDARRFEPLLLAVVLAAGLSSAVAGVVALATS